MVLHAHSCCTPAAVQAVQQHRLLEADPPRIKAHTMDTYQLTIIASVVVAISLLVLIIYARSRTAAFEKLEEAVCKRTAAAAGM